MPLEPSIKRILESTPPERSLEIAHLPLGDALQRLRSRPSAKLAPPQPVRTRDVSAQGDAGSIPIRLYLPDEAASGVLVNFHGGGWVLGSIEQDDYLCHMIARAAGCVVASVDYRLAPECTFPGPVEDCYAAARWIAANASRLTGGGSRIALCGSSAGGNLAAATALMARDRGAFAPAYQILLYPICDCDFTRPSYRENAKGYGLSTGTMAWFWDRYVPDLHDRENAYAAPLRAASLEGLPPALIMTAEFDPLRDEGRDYADRLRAAGTPVELVEFAGLTHGFFRMIPDAPWTGTVVDLAAKGLKAAFGQSDDARKTTAAGVNAHA